jgi:hypothetical protein
MEEHDLKPTGGIILRLPFTSEVKCPLLSLPQTGFTRF